MISHQTFAGSPVFISVATRCLLIQYSYTEVIGIDINKRDKCFRYHTPRGYGMFDKVDQWPLSEVH